MTAIQQSNRLRLQRGLQQRGSTRRRGVALMLTFMAVLIAATVAYPFLSAQSTSVGIARNIKNHTKARYVAETGLELALAYIQANENWRTDQSHGNWATDKSFGDGTYTIVGEDGTDTDDDGTVDGDGDLSNDPSDALTLTVTGEVNGTTCIVRAIVTPTICDCDGPGLVVSGLIEVKSNPADSGVARITPQSNCASIATNATSPNQIVTLGSGSISTDIYIGPGSDINDEPGNVVKAESGGTITGTIGVLDEAIEIPTLTEPTNVGSDLGDLTLSSGVTTWDTNQHYTKLNVSGSAILEINGDVTVLCDDDVTFEDNAQLEISEGSTFTLYVKQTCSIEDEVLLNINTLDPGKFVIQSLATGPQAVIEILNDSQLCATIVGPACELNVSDNSVFYGTFVGETVVAEDASRIYVTCREDFAGDSGSSGEQLTLRPSNAGSSTNLSGSGSGAGNWDRVNDETPDDDATYVASPSKPPFVTDTYTTEDSGISTGTINSVTIHMRASMGSGGSKATTVLRTGGADYSGSDIGLNSTEYSDHFTTYETNPATGSAWTWADIDDMEIGVSTRKGARCTQVYAIVEYGASDPSEEPPEEETSNSYFYSVQWVPAN